MSSLARLIRRRRRWPVWLYSAFATSRRFVRNDQVVLFVLAVVLGAAAAYAAILFRWTIQLVQTVAFGTGAEAMVAAVEALPWWQVLATPALGGLAIGALIRWGMPERRPLAVADVIEATAIHGGRMSFLGGLRAAFINAASLGVGGSAGREGPVVHLGAAIAALAAQRLHLTRTMTNTLLGCGVAAAVAASFNAPIAGAFFALEVVVGHYALSAFAPIVIASVVGTLISRAHFGNFPAFIVPEHFIVSWWEFGVFAALGVASAAAAMIFMRGIFAVQDQAARLPVPPWLHPAIGGLAVGGIAVFFPHVLGVGYEATDAALKGQFGLVFLLMLLGAKLVATSVTLGMGFGGGVFSPSLMVGALLGGVFGLTVAMGAPPGTVSGVGAYAMVGMGAVAGAVLGAPISTILIIFELTADYRMTIAVMVAVVVASVIVQRLFGRSFFHLQLNRRGVHLRRGVETSLVRGRSIRNMIDERCPTVAPDTGLPRLRRALLQASEGEVMVVDADRRFLGSITLGTLRDAEDEEDAGAQTTAAEIARDRPLIRYADDLESALRIFTDAELPRLPVVDDAESRVLVGVLHERDVLLSYQRALVQARAEERGEI